MLEVRAEKRSLIEEYVPNEMTLASAHAVDVSDPKLTKRSATQVEADRRVTDSERSASAFSTGRGRS